MGSVTAKDIPLETEFMNEYWGIRKKFYIPEDTDEDSQAAAEAYSALAEKYGGSHYILDVIFAACRDYDRKLREIRKDGKHEIIHGGDSR